MTKKALETIKLKVLRSLRESRRLTRAQLTMGALRHVTGEERAHVLKRLTKEGLITSELLDRGYGAPATCYSLTDTGIKVAESIQQATQHVQG